MYDVIIAGGGPAGLNAALVLGRCRRRVLLCDLGRPRNAPSRGVNGFLTRDGIPPAELRRLARAELANYPSVELRDGAEVVAAERHGGDGGAGEGAPPRFAVTLSDGAELSARRLLLATGLEEELPQIEGLAGLWGQGVFDCPYCDGWEMRDAPLAVLGRGAAGRGLALELMAWSRDVVLCSDGPCGLDRTDRDRLARHGIALREERIARLEPAEDGGGLGAIRFADGSALPRRGLFIATRRRLPRLPRRLDLPLTHGGTVRTGRYEGTEVPGLFVAGDASRRVQFAIVAAAEGAMAAFAINNELLKEDLR